MTSLPASEAAISWSRALSLEGGRGGGRGEGRGGEGRGGEGEGGGEGEVCMVRVQFVIYIIHTKLYGKIYPVQFVNTQSKISFYGNIYISRIVCVAGFFFQHSSADLYPHT